jgi:hypothetical protein
MYPDVTEAVGRIVAERDEATRLMNAEADFAKRREYKGKRKGLERAIDLLVEEGVIVP